MNRDNGVGDRAGVQGIQNSIVFLAGGAGSGKGFAISHFMEKEKFKVRDVDEWKKAFMKLADTKKLYPEIRGLSLRDPKSVMIKSILVTQLRYYTEERIQAKLKHPRQLDYQSAHNTWNELLSIDWELVKPQINHLAT